uniref:Uncharacterized protein n=1 Tax=Pithovirus LCDPAC02 TaxID=2506601 RepID=A0A481YQ45_9VIRU|nr:MAG: hypothetical protein LCDPAC02_02360 [Pithovirus LCDPAC02]
MCSCQLPTDLSNYVWAFDKNNFELNNPDYQDIYISIAPKDYFHWDGGLVEIIGIQEVYESTFECCDIQSFIETNRIEFSQDLDDLINKNADCTCLYCFDYDLFFAKYGNLTFVNNGKECSHSYRHIDTYLSNIEYLIF